MNWFYVAFGAIGAGLVSWAWRDGYACLPRLQILIINLAARQMPEHVRTDLAEQWRADIADLWPSEVWRTLSALDMLRAGFILRRQMQPATVKVKASSPTYGEVARTGLKVGNAYGTVFALHIIERLFQEKERALEARWTWHKFAALVALGAGSYFFTPLVRDLINALMV